MKNLVCFSLFVAVLVVFKIQHAESRMTMLQIINTMKPLGKTCAAKTGLTKEMQDGQHEGNFPDDETLHCYLSCLLKMAKVADKTGKLNIDAMIKQIDILMPEELIDRAKTACNACADLVTGTEGCRPSWEFMKCWYEKEPETFFYSENFIKMIQENDEHGMSIAAKCFAACALSHVGLMKDGKMHVNQIEDKLSSMIDTIRLCADEANENTNECVVVGKFGECLKENDL
ncbi:hypothetical protein G9C98_007785 [Cotesia typhae]|uniref:Uncharacterized protein n=1 Tax=Cotesia typhae TaxID=2053667 RepID=A0A8J5R1C3_9HYME|nr:hypothetical protein G9C98_007785 [Cotesia typhae]